MKWGSYWRLMRFHKPVGILLLWFPTAWALWIANQGVPPWQLLVYFSLGTLLMRAAGCVLNDMVDRHIDLHVKRTQQRPLTSGEVGLLEASCILLGLLLGACIVLVQLPSVCFYYALAALGVTVLYPFCKRFFQAPQLILGIAFSMGIPMAFVASGKSADIHMVFLLLINFCWIVAYDTMYAMMDREDDLRIGVKSTAIWFGQYDCLMILLLQCFFHGAWLVLALDLHESFTFYGVWCLATALLIYQQKLLNTRLPEACFKAFSLSVGYGGIMWMSLF